MKRLAAILLVFALAAIATGIAQEKQIPPIKDGPAIVRGTGYIPLTPQKKRFYQKQSRAAHGGRIRQLEKFQAVPAKFDCRDKGWLIKTFDQASCGSCYLDSTIRGTLTASFIMAGYGKNDGSFVMSTQYGMDCHNFGGCNGGNGTEVIDWIMSNGWYAETYIDLMGTIHKDYPPYSARSMSCRKVAGAKVWKPATWGFVNSNRQPTVDEIKAAMFKFGPLNIALDAGGQFGNGTGTITSMGSSINHEINCVGWDDAKDGGSFLLWNQWGEGWGNGGFRWCTYQASKRIVDWFFISVDPLPAPPPDPEPEPPDPEPGPNPGVRINGITVKYTDGTSQDLDTMPAGTSAIVDQLLEKLRPIRAVEKTPTVEPPTLGDPSSKRIDELEKNMGKMLDEIIKIQKLLVDPPKKTSQLTSPEPKESVYEAYRNLPPLDIRAGASAIGALPRIDRLAFESGGNK